MQKFNYHHLLLKNINLNYFYIFMIKFVNKIKIKKIDFSQKYINYDKLFYKI